MRHLNTYILSGIDVCATGSSHSNYKKINFQEVKDEWKTICVYVLIKSRTWPKNFSASPHLVLPSVSKQLVPSDRL